MSNRNNSRDFSKMLKAERHKALLEMSDKDIDYSDIPALDEEFFKTAKRVANPLHRKENNIRVRPEVLEWFRNHAGRKNYETLINDVLENYVKHQGER